VTSHCDTEVSTDEIVSAAIAGDEAAFAALTERHRRELPAFGLPPAL